MLDDGWLTQITAYFLMGSVDDAMDSVSREPLCDWKCLKVQIDFRNDYKCFGIGIFPQKLVNYLTIEKLKFAYYTCSAFLQAHKIARRKIQEYMGIYLIIFIIMLQLFICCTLCDHRSFSLAIALGCRSCESRLVFLLREKTELNAWFGLCDPKLSIYNKAKG